MKTDSDSSQLKRLSIEEMKSCPVMNLWALSELNNLPFHPGDSVSECWIHWSLAACLFGKRSLKSAQNTTLNKATRHPTHSGMVLYGDLHRPKHERGE